MHELKHIALDPEIDVKILYVISDPRSRLHWLIKSKKDVSISEYCYQDCVLYWNPTKILYLNPITIVWCLVGNISKTNFKSIILVWNRVTDLSTDIFGIENNSPIFGTNNWPLTSDSFSVFLFVLSSCVHICTYKTLGTILVQVPGS